MRLLFRGGVKIEISMIVLFGGVEGWKGQRERHRVNMYHQCVWFVMRVFNLNFVQSYLNLC